MKVKDLKEIDGIKIGDQVRYKDGFLGAGRIQYVRFIWQDEEGNIYLDLMNRNNQLFSSDVMSLTKLEKFEYDNLPVNKSIYNT